MVLKPKSSVAVIGGGYAGMAAAVALAEAGVKVSVFEAGKVLGGRARGLELEGRSLDNGQHLLIGAYTSLLAMMEKVGVDLQGAFLRLPMELVVEPGFRLACPRLPAPLHLALGLILAQGLTWTERFALLKTIRSAQSANWQLTQDMSVAQWLVGQPAMLISRFWQPLTVAALNTPLEQASAQVLLNVLRDSLGGKRAASDLLLPRLDFSSLFPDAAALYVQQQGGQVFRSQRINQIKKSTAGWHLNDHPAVFDAIVCAVAPHSLSSVLADWPQLLPAQLNDWSYQPIVTVYLQYPADTRLTKPMLGLSDSLAQWVFDRGYSHGTPGLVAVVISAVGSHQSLTQQELVSALVAQLHQRLHLPSEVSWQQVITEKRGTFACTPNMQRPANQTAEPGFCLAGDYTAGLAGIGDYPATLEGAVRSGMAAASGLLGQLN